MRPKRRFSQQNLLVRTNCGRPTAPRYVRSRWNILRPVHRLSATAGPDCEAILKAPEFRALEDPMMEVAGLVLICSVAAWLAEEVVAPEA
jgi:hypothetical protein